MGKAKYFRVLGYIELALYIVGSIALFINLFNNGPNPTAGAVLLKILYFIICLIFGPAFGMLLLDHARFLEKEYNEKNPVHDVSKMKPLTIGDDVKQGLRVMNLSKYQDEDIVIPEGTIGTVEGVGETTLKVVFVIGARKIQVIKPYEFFAKSDETIRI